MTILLIEDEPLVGRQLEKLVRQLEPTANVVGPLPSVRRVAEHLHTQPLPDLIISDIQLADGVSFDVLAEVSCPLIFTTAYDEYAIRAFKLNSIDYLLKPIDADELSKALAKFHRWQPDDIDFQRQFRQLLTDLSGQQNGGRVYKRRFLAHHGRQIVPVVQEQVACFVRDELIFLYTTDGQRLVTDYRTLDELEELTDPAAFFRANRQVLLNVVAIAGYQPHHTGKLLLTLRPPVRVDDVTISKDKAAAFRAWFEQG